MTDVHAFLARHKLGVLGTIGETGTPQSALVGIAVTPDLEIVFDTVKTSRKNSVRRSWSGTRRSTSRRGRNA